MEVDDDDLRPPAQSVGPDLDLEDALNDEPTSDDAMSEGMFDRPKTQPSRRSPAGGVWEEEDDGAAALFPPTSSRANASTCNGSASTSSVSVDAACGASGAPSAAPAENGEEGEEGKEGEAGEPPVTLDPLIAQRRNTLLASLVHVPPGSAAETAFAQRIASCPQFYSATAGAEPARAADALANVDANADADAAASQPPSVALFHQRFHDAMQSFMTVNERSVASIVGLPPVQHTTPALDAMLAKACDEMDALFRPNFHTAIPASETRHQLPLRDVLKALRGRVSKMREHKHGAAHIFRDALTTKKKLESEIEQYNRAVRAAAKRDERATRQKESAEAADAQLRALSDRQAKGEFKAHFATHPMEAWERPPRYVPGSRVLLPPECVRIQRVSLDTCEMPLFGTSIVDVYDAQNTAVMRPTPTQTLLLEAGMGSGKTRQLMNFVSAEMERDPSTRVVFVACKVIHSVDMSSDVCKFAAWAHANYKYVDVTEGSSRSQQLNLAQVVVVSLQSLNMIDCTIFANAIVVLDEVSTLARIPGSETLRWMSNLTTQLATLGRQSRAMVALDADVSADGAAACILQIVCPDRDVLHVRLMQPALKRTVALSFQGTGLGGPAFHARQELAILKARSLTLRWLYARRAHREGLKTQLAGRRAAYVATKRDEGSDATALALETEFDASAEAQRFAPHVGVRFPELYKEQWAKAVGLLGLVWLARRVARRKEDGEWTAEECATFTTLNAYDGEEKRVVLALKSTMQSLLAAKYDRPRVWCGCATTKKAEVLREFCERYQVDYRLYQGTGCEKVKKLDFQDTETAWRDTTVVICTSTITVAVDVNVHFSSVFIDTTAHRKCARFGDFCQMGGRAGRHELDDLEDPCICWNVDGVNLGTVARMQVVPQMNRFLRVHLPAAHLRDSQLKHHASAASRALDSEDAALPRKEDAASLRSDAEVRLDAWNQLEASDQDGANGVVKLLELFSLPTRQWKVHPALPLPDNDADYLESLKGTSKAGEGGAGDTDANRRFGERTMEDRFDMLCQELHEEAEREDDPEAALQELGRVMMAAHATQGESRPMKDARQQVEERVYSIARRVGDGQSFPFHVAGKRLTGPAFVRLERQMDLIEMRAHVRHVSLELLQKNFAGAAQAGRVTDAQNRTPWSMWKSQLQRIAGALDMTLDELLSSATFTTETPWVQANNRLLLGQTAQTPEDKQRLKTLHSAYYALKGNPGNSRNHRMMWLVEQIYKEFLLFQVHEPQTTYMTTVGDVRKVQLVEMQVCEMWRKVEDEVLLRLPVDLEGVARKIKASLYDATLHQLTLAMQSAMGITATTATTAPPQRVRLASTPAPLPNALVRSLNQKHSFHHDVKTERYDQAALRSLLADLQDGAAENASALANLTAQIQALEGKIGWYEDFEHVHLAVLNTTLSGARILVDVRGEGAYPELPMLERVHGTDSGALLDLAATVAHLCRTEWNATLASLLGVADGQELDRCHAFKAGVDVVVVCEISNADVDLEHRGVEWCTLAELQPDKDGTLHGILRAGLQTMLETYRTTNFDSIVSPQQLCVSDSAAEASAKAECARLYHLGYAMERRAQMLEYVGLLAEELDEFTERPVLYSQRNGAGRRYAAALKSPAEIVSEGALLRKAMPDQGDPDRRNARFRQTLFQPMYRDIRGLLAGPCTFDVDCENGDLRHMVDLHRLYKEASNASQLPRGAPKVPGIKAIREYVEHRDEWLQDIMERTGVDRQTAKRLPNCISFGGSVDTWARNNRVTIGAQRLEKIDRLTRAVKTLRRAVAFLPQYRAIWESTEAQKRADRKGGKLAASCFAMVLQTRENECLKKMDAAFYRRGFNALALVFDGLLLQPKEWRRSEHSRATPEELQAMHATAEQKVRRAMEAVQEELNNDGYSVVLAVKPMDNSTGEYTRPETIVNARNAVAQFRGQAAASHASTSGAGSSREHMEVSDSDDDL